MKKSFICCLIVSTICLAGCASGSTVKTDEENNSIESVEPIDITVSYADLEEAINKTENIKIDNNVILNDLTQIKHLYTYTERYASRLSNKEAYDNFITTFHYIFPDEQLDEESLFYYGSNSHPTAEKFLNKVKDYRDEIMDGTEDVLYFYYDDVVEHRDNLSGHFLEATSPIGNDLSRFNRGELRKLIGCGMEVPWPPQEFIATYAPEALETFTMCDGVRMSISDAVNMFEEYINSIPVNENSITDVRVAYVNVYKLEDEKYVYHMQLTKSYDGLKYDCVKGGTVNEYGTESYMGLLGQGYVVNSYEVDYADFSNRLNRVSDIKPIAKILSPGEAVMAIGDKITAEIEFLLREVELVYCQKMVNGENTGESVDDPLVVAPAWKFSLYNPNDNKTYVCYIDAETGEKFRYKTLSEKKKE